MTARLLTAAQVGALLDVDASTIYRMAGDGRLRGVRVGRQWRFPDTTIDDLLGGVAQPPGTASRDTDRPARTIPSPTATAVLQAIAPALGVTMVVTDLDGSPLTPVVNPAPAIAARLDEPDFLPSCTDEWRAFAAEAHLAPRLRVGHFGFLCAHSLVRRGPTLVAMVLAGGIAPESDHTPDLFHLDVARRQVLLETLPRTAALLSRLLPEG
jgi:excisionase family DNA binding protein